MSNYPPGGEDDPRAPYNQIDDSEAIEDHAERMLRDPTFIADRIMHGMSRDEALAIGRVIASRSREAFGREVKRLASALAADPDVAEAVADDLARYLERAA